MEANRYIKKRKVSDLEFATGYDEGLGVFKLSYMLEEARANAELILTGSSLNRFKKPKT